jgi:hypothetical protein
VELFIESKDTDINKNYHDPRTVDTPMIIRVYFTPHGARRNYFQDKMILLVTKNSMIGDRVLR